MADKKYVQNLLSNLIALDIQTTRAYYEMGQLLHALFEGALHEVLGYASFTELVDEELSFTSGTAHNYRKMYWNFKRLHYNKAEALKILNTCGLTRLNDVMPEMATKTGARAIRNKIDALGFHQINFTVTTEELEEVHAVLIAYGAEITSAGRFENSSDAFMHLVHGKSGKPKLKLAS